MTETANQIVFTYNAASSGEIHHKIQPNSLSERYDVVYHEALCCYQEVREVPDIIIDSDIARHTPVCTV